MFQPKSRVRYVPTVGPVRPATVLARVGIDNPPTSHRDVVKVNDLEAYQIRLMDGRKLTVHASQLRANPASQIQPKIER